MAAAPALALSNVALVLSAAALIASGLLETLRLRHRIVAMAVVALATGVAVAAGPASAGIGLATTATLTCGLIAVGSGARLVRQLCRETIDAALLILMIALCLTLGPFLLGPALDFLSADAARWLLFANPWVMTASAAGIDPLHLDWIYQLSPLAHRGVALPHWSAACAAYAAFGLVCYGAARLFPQESTNP